MEGTKKIHFSYDEDTMSNHKAFIWFWGIIFVTSYIACAMIWGTNAPAIPFVSCLSTFFISGAGDGRVKMKRLNGQ